MLRPATFAPLANLSACAPRPGLPFGWRQKLFAQRVAEPALELGVVPSPGAHKPPEDVAGGEDPHDVDGGGAVQARLETALLKEGSTTIAAPPHRSSSPARHSLYRSLSDVAAALSTSCTSADLPWMAVTLRAYRRRARRGSGSASASRHRERWATGTGSSPARAMLRSCMRIAAYCPLRRTRSAWRRRRARRSGRRSWPCSPGR